MKRFNFNLIEIAIVIILCALDGKGSMTGVLMSGIISVATICVLKRLTGHVS
jgi:hypothetical protein